MIYQDCSPAVQVAENRGSLAKKTKAMDIRVFSIRNRIEDDEVQLKLISTLKMVADVGTKALDRRQFEFCRDVLNGYALAKSAGNTTATAAALVITLDELTSSSSAS